MIPAVYDLEFRTLPGQEKHCEIPLIIHAHSMPVLHGFLSHGNLESLLPVIQTFADIHEMQVIADIKFDVHQ